MSRTLYGYWRSSAAYRVRIALGLKGLTYEPAMVDLRINRHSDAEYLRMNPQGMVPILVDDGQPLTQSLAIIEYLDEVYPEPKLIPGDPVQRSRIRSLAQIVACDIHPLNNLRVLNYLRKDLGVEEEGVNAWARRWIEAGFATLETMLSSCAGQYLHCDSVTLADICLVPQMYNARRVETDLSHYPALLALEERLQRLEAFDKARPENQPEATS